MARVVLGSYMVRYPLGGMLSWVLQYLVGFKQLGHDVYFVEKSGYAKACYDPVRDVMTDDCSYGARVVHALLSRYGLGGAWCYVDAGNTYHGLSRSRVQEVCRTADVFVDMGTHGAWLEETAAAGLRVLLDGEPGFTQMKIQNRSAAGEQVPGYDAYYTTGRNVGTTCSSAPSADRPWRPIFHPVVTSLFPVQATPPEAPFTTIMNWQSYEPLDYRGRRFGHKDIEFEKFVSLPSKTGLPLEIAVSGKTVPAHRLRNAGWRIRDAHEVTMSFDRFRDYVSASRAEFGVCKNGFVATRTGWFSDRSAAYLASGRPVVLQDTGFSRHLPCGCGLMAVDTVEEAAAAIDEIAGDYPRHVAGARAIAEECLESTRVLGQFLDELEAT